MTTYYCGVDVGTSRSSICTSTGKRLTVESCIGYAKDVVALKRFGKPYLLGIEALSNRLALDLIYPLADGVLNTDPRSIEGMNLIIKNLVHAVLPDLKEDDEVYAAVGTPAQASLENNKDLLQVCKGVFKKVLVVSEPFMVAYGMDMFDEALIIDIGAGTVDLSRIHGTLPEAEDQRSLTTAGNYLDSLIEKYLLAEYPKVQVTKNIIRKMKEKLGYADNLSHAVSFTLTEAGKPSSYEVGDILSKSIRETVKPICAAVQDLVATFDPEFQERLRNNIIIAGGGSRLRGIERAIEDALKEYGGGSARCTEDPEFGGAMGALKMSLEMPDDLWEEVK
jgi:rod shape-determining protein MreB and related proteins